MIWSKSYCEGAEATGVVYVAALDEGDETGVSARVDVVRSRSAHQLASGALSWRGFPALAGDRPVPGNVPLLQTSLARRAAGFNGPRWSSQPGRKIHTNGNHSLRIDLKGDSCVT